jgi:hypothetical protein
MRLCEGAFADQGCGHGNPCRSVSPRSDKKHSS